MRIALSAKQQDDERHGEKVSSELHGLLHNAKWSMNFRNLASFPNNTQDFGQSPPPLPSYHWDEDPDAQLRRTTTLTTETAAAGESKRVIIEAAYCFISLG